MFQKPEQDTFGNDTTDYNVLFAYRVDRNVQILNHCLDDIESFASRIQKAHEAAKEVSHRQSINGSIRSTGESIYSLRSKPPSKNEYLTVFAQMKEIDLNLITKLKSSLEVINYFSRRKLTFANVLKRKV